MAGYVVTAEVQPEHPMDADSEQVATWLDGLLDRLTDMHGSVSGDRHGWSATVTVDADDLDQACAVAREWLLRHAEDEWLPTSPLTRIEVVREDIRDAELERPTMPDLVSGPEAAEMLRVTRQRLHQLAASNPEFPTPAYRLGVGMLWHRTAIERFAAEWERRPGRPPAKADRELASA